MIIDSIRFISIISCDVEMLKEMIKEIFKYAMTTKQSDGRSCIFQTCFINTSEGFVVSEEKKKN